MVTSNHKIVLKVLTRTLFVLFELLFTMITTKKYIKYTQIRFLLYGDKETSAKCIHEKQI